jgi:hypothetical protein
MSADAVGDGEALGAGVEEESPKLAPSDLLAATSTIAAVDKSPLGVMSNTLCLKLGRFGVEECPGAIFEANPKDAGQRGKGRPRATRQEGQRRAKTGGRRRRSGDSAQRWPAKAAQRCTAKRQKMHKDAPRRREGAKARRREGGTNMHNEAAENAQRCTAKAFRVRIHRTQKMHKDAQSEHK